MLWVEKCYTMIYSVTGNLVHTEPGAAVVDVGGVAFRCMTSMNTLRSLPRLSEKVTLYTYLNVREDALDLFGFATKGELSCFRLRTGISGVGPKVGLAILSQLTPEDVALAAAAGDAKRFTKASGVGQKLAQRIVLELKDKVAKGFVDGISLEDVAGATSTAPAAQGAGQAIAALVSLGYSQSEAAMAVSKIDATLPVEEIIKLALRGMAGRR